MSVTRLVVPPIEVNFSLKNKIYEALKESIAAMNIYADDAELRLDERQLSDMMGVSRTPIREAIARLEQEGMVRIVELDPKQKTIVWSYDASKQNGNDGKRVEVHSFLPLADGHLLLAESGPARCLEIDRAGTLLRQMAFTVRHPDAHRDTRLMRQLPNGNLLVCHEGDGCVREYDSKTGVVVFEFEVPLFGKERKNGHGPEAFGNQVFGAVRLPTGNTLIATGNGHSLLEVDAKKKIVWALHQNDLPNIVLAWVTTIEVLANGHYVLGNCHAGLGQPVLIEIEPLTKQVVWTLDAFPRFGNSVSNSLLLDVTSLR